MEHIKSIWSTIYTYVDIDTGETLTKHIVNNQYTIINKIKTVKRHENSTKKYVEILNECRRNKYRQQRIEFTQTN